MRSSTQSEQPGVASSDSPVYSQDFEIEREDGRGKFLTIVDATHFDAYYEYLFVVPEEEKRGPNKMKAPFHKMALKLVIYEPNESFGEAKGSWKHYMEVKEFLRLCEIVRARPIPPPLKDASGREIPENKYGVELFKGVGFSKNIGKELTVSVMESSKNPGVSSYRIAFRQGEAVENPNGPGFKFTSKPPVYSINLPEDFMLRAFLSSYNHVESLRTAVNTNMFNKLYGKK